LTVTNDDDGIPQAIKEIKKHHPSRIIIEATGRLEFGSIAACFKSGLPFVVANPAHLSKLISALGQLAKTGKTDAKSIAHYGETIQPPMSTLKPAVMRSISDLLVHCFQLLTMQTMAKNHFQIGLE